MNKLLRAGTVMSDPITCNIAAVSAGLYAGQAVLDLDYAEDSEAGVDANFVMTSTGRMVEVQMSGESSTFGQDDLTRLLALADQGVKALVAAQDAAVA